jgi:hypothetical protein
LRAILGLLRETEIHNRQRHIEVLNALGQGKKRVSFDFKVGVPKLKASKHMLEITITNEEQVKVTLSPKTDSGRPAKLDGSPAWTVTSGNSQVVVADDGLSADLISSDDPGDTTISVKADADLGSGVEEISDTIVLTVTGARAKNLGLAAGTPTPKPTV